MTLDEFIMAEIGRVKRFKKFWRQQQKAACTPDEKRAWSEKGMTEGDWDEQLMCFEDSDRDEVDDG